MKKRFLFLVISCLCSYFAAAQSRVADFMRALEAKDMKKAEEILHAWDLADANDANLYIAYFNFYTVKSKDAGILSTNGYEMNNAKKALEFISEGITRFPTRFDLRIGKLYMLRELKDYKAYADEVIQMIVYSDKIKNNWKSADFTILDHPEEMFFGAVVDCQEFLFKKNDSSLFKDIFRISDEMLKYYPKFVQSHINNSMVYDAQKEFDKSLAELKKGEKIAPENALLLYHIAFVYSQKEDKSNSKKYYELTVQHCDNKQDKLKEAALKRLEEMK